MPKSAPKRFSDYIVWNKVPQICIGTYAVWFVGVWVIFVIQADVDPTQYVGIVALSAAGAWLLSITIVALFILIDMHIKKPIPPKERVEN